MAKHDLDPNSGEVYCTLTNNTRRTEEQVDAANPIANNQNGHIVRWMEAGNDHGATSFDWDIFVFAGLPGSETVVEGDAVVTLNDDNIFNSPDVKTMFVNIQHPEGNWPDSSDPRPRDATVIVTRDDGGVIGA